MPRAGEMKLAVRERSLTLGVLEARNATNNLL